MSTWKGYRITSPFGWRNHPITKQRSFHTGIDLVIGHKKPIKAFTDGKVLFSGTGMKGTGLGGYGISVLIEDRNGRGHLYSHLDSVSVKVGDVVSVGQEIGKQGATGNVTGSHLHYEIRKTTKPLYGWIGDRENNCLDPIPYVEGFKGNTMLKIDGILGKNTISRLQQYLGTPIDGEISRPSLMVKELQKRLNNNKL